MTSTRLLGLEVMMDEDFIVELLTNEISTLSLKS